MSESRRAWIAQWPRALSGSKLGVTLFCNLGFIFFQILYFQIVLFQSFSLKLFLFCSTFLVL